MTIVPELAESLLEQVAVLSRLLAANSSLSARLPSRLRFSWRDSRVYFWPLMKRRSLPLRRAYSALRTRSRASPRWRMMWNLSNRMAACGTVGGVLPPLGPPGNSIQILQGLAHGL